MKQIYTLLLICLLLTVSRHVKANSDTLDLPKNSFSKGRVLIGINGFVNSSTLELEHINRVKDEQTSYQLNFFTEIYSKNKLGLAWNIGVQRSETQSIISQESEFFRTGPSIRYYVTNNKNGSIYPKISLLYGRHFENTMSNIPNNEINLNFKGNALVAEFGIGFSYVFMNRMVFNIELDYNGSQIYGRIFDRLTDIERKITITRFETDLKFGLAFFFKD